MTEHINDPCKEEVGEVVSPEGPSIPPEPTTVPIQEAVFPTRQEEPIEVQTIRQSALIEEGLFYDNFVIQKLRFPNQAPGPDTFRYVAAMGYQFEGLGTFEGGELSYINSNLRQNGDIGVPFDTQIGRLILVRGGYNQRPIETSSITLKINKLLFGLLLNATDPNVIRSGKPIEVLLAEWINGTGRFRFTKPLIPHDTEIMDLSFLAPAAFFGVEAEQSIVPLVDTVSITPVVGNLPLIETSRPEIQKPGLYRLFTSTRPEREGFESVIQNDSIQVFGADAVSIINDLSSLATDSVSLNQVYVDAEQTLNNHMRIDLSLNNKSEFCEALQDNNLDELFMDFLQHYGLSPNQNNLSREYVQILDQSILGGGINNKLVPDYKPKIWDLDFFINEIANDTNTAMLLMGSLVDRHPLPYYDQTFREVARDTQAASILGTLQRFFELFLERKRRRTRNVLSGKQCYSEIVAYRIEKSRIFDNGTKEVIQNFYLFNEKDTKTLSFLDSQVSYNRMYEYKIYAINLVVGSKMKYFQDTPYTPQSFEGATPEVNFRMHNTTVAHLIETPYFSQKLAMLDKPPIFPQAEILPFFQNAERVAIRLTPTFGSIKEEPIAILPQDNEIIERMKMASVSSSGEIEYSSDSQPTNYEILVLDTPPSTYQDFSRAQRFSTRALYNSGYIELGLVSNKRYYMVYRASDVSGISNPSLVYTLVLNSHADGTYVEYDEFDLVAREAEEEITFERFLKIDPAPSQTTMDFSEMAEQEGFYLTAPDVEEVKLGPHENEGRVWTKDYKFRLISRTTGKALDINVNYGLKLRRHDFPGN